MRTATALGTILVVVGCTLLAFVLAGCGGSSGTTVAPETPTTTTTTTTKVTAQKERVVVWSQLLERYYYITNIHMPSGKTLMCIEAYAYSDGGPSLTCNFDKYNKEVAGK